MTQSVEAVHVILPKQGQTAVAGQAYFCLVDSYLFILLFRMIPQRHNI